MNFIHNIDTFFHFDGHEGYLFAEVSYFIYAVIGGGIHFHDIKGAVEGKAGSTFTARVAVYGIFTVYCLGKNLCAGSFTCTS